MLECETYEVTDQFFGAPYIDVDEPRTDPVEYRHVHGGFAGTDTRFTFYFPPAERYQGRLYQPLEGANAGHEDTYGGPLGLMVGGLDMTFRLGGFMVESNMGHIGDVMDAKAGPDPTLYGWRAAAETARFAKHVGAQVYGEAPKFSYVFGGSGGARRSPLCLAYAPGVWDAAMPYMGDAIDGEYGDFSLVRGAAPNFAAMFNVQRLLGDKIWNVVDAMLPGGSGDPFAGLDTHESEELANLYRLGYPRGDEFMIAQPMGQIWLWTSMAQRLSRDDPYFKDFWTKPGFVGFDQPAAVTGDLLDAKLTVTRTLTASDLRDDPEFAGPEYAQVRHNAELFAAFHHLWDTPMALQIGGLPKGYLLGAGIELTSGEAAGRQLYCMAGYGDVLLGSGEGEAANRRFEGVAVGDEVHVDNHDFLAFCYFYRHHLMPHAEYQFLTVDGNPVYQQYELPQMSPFMGTCHTAQYEGKLMWVHHTHDASLWPPQGIGFHDNVIRLHGAEEGKKRFRLRWTDNAEHVPPGMAGSPPGRDNKTWLIDYQPVIEQCLADLAAWVEDDVEPIETNFNLKDGRIVLPSSAGERLGIQPVVTVNANGGARADVRVGEEVQLEALAELADGVGTIVGVKWDFDGSGTYPEIAEIDGTSTSVKTATTHTFEKAGTFFVTALVESHRDGDVNATSRRVPNVASARVVVS
ncbi:MAG: hypothetical protein JWM76_3616 [Pseudonocardiales bacterium]|nr:hypothetical protein [Pseudonocardiales bacterium]